MSTTLPATGSSRPSRGLLNASPALIKVLAGRCAPAPGPGLDLELESSFSVPASQGLNGRSFPTLELL